MFEFNGMAAELRLQPMFECLNFLRVLCANVLQWFVSLDQYTAFRAGSTLQSQLQEHLPAQPSFPVQ